MEGRLRNKIGIVNAQTSKVEAEPVDFAKINNGEVKKDTKLYAIGKLKPVTDDPIIEKQ